MQRGGPHGTEFWRSWSLEMQRLNVPTDMVQIVDEENGSFV